MHQFTCVKDPSIAFFLSNKSVDYEKIHKSRTFLIVDENEMNNGNIIILGYFSLALKVLTIPETISTNKIKKLDGLSARRKGTRITNFAVFLIGQLAKNDKYGDHICGRELVDISIGIIKEVQKNVGGRVILIECNNHEKLINFYSGVGFEIISSDNDGLQMIAFL